MRTVRSHLGWGWAGLGLAGSLIVALAGSDLIDHEPVRWWFHVGLPGGHDAHTIVLTAGMLALSAAWLGLGGRLKRAPDTRPRDVIVIGALWSIPLAVGPALFSRDMYSYLADGAIFHLGLDPYHHAPAVLAQLHQPQLVDAVSKFWRHTTAPYGPSFVGLSGVVAAVAGSNLIAGALLMRLLELPGMILLAIFVPRLARALGTDATRATWLAVISPLVLLELIAAGHNDALMAGLLVAGVTLALERRPLLGILVCSLAATIKLPAAAGVLFIAICWAREEPRSAVRIALWSALTAGAALAAVSLITGLGFGWIAGGISTPARVRLAITPATALGHSISTLLSDVGIIVHAKPLESAARAVAFALTAALAVVLSYRVRYEKLVLYLGVLLLASVLGGPATWPWYMSWGLALIATCEIAQRTRWLPVVIAAVVFLVRADGQMVLPIDTAIPVLAVYLAAALVAVRRASPSAPALSAAEFAR